MSQLAWLPKRGQGWLAVAALAPLALVALYNLVLFREDPTRLTMVAATVIFAALFAVYNFAEDWRVSAGVLVLQAVLCALAAFGFGLRGELVFIFLAILSTQLGVSLPPRGAALGFAGLSAIVLGAAFAEPAPFSTNLVVALGTATGCSLFAIVGGLLREGLMARARSEALAQELQAANEQLQALSLKLQQLAVIEERARMARELHDTLGHHLTAAVMQLEGVQRLLDADPERARQIASALRAQLKEGLAELRRTVSALREPEARAQPLATALSRLANTVQETCGLPVHLEIRAAPPMLSQAQELALFRAAQEGLTNVQRHAQAQNAWLTFDTEDGWVCLSVEDDGTGPTSNGSSGFGLQGLRERAAELGGAVEFGRSPHGGARLAVRLPLA